MQSSLRRCRSSCIEWEYFYRIRVGTWHLYLGDVSWYKSDAGDLSGGSIGVCYIIGYLCRTFGDCRNSSIGWCKCSACDCFIGRTVRQSSDHGRNCGSDHNRGNDCSVHDAFQKDREKEKKQAEIIKEKDSVESEVEKARLILDDFDDEDETED